MWLYLPAGMEDVAGLTGEEINSPGAYLVFLNGLIVGAHARPDELVFKVTCSGGYSMELIHSCHFSSEANMIEILSFMVHH